MSHRVVYNVVTYGYGKCKLSAQVSAQVSLTDVYNANHIQNSLCVSNVEYLNFKQVVIIISMFFN
jgi:hypothetical protein